MMPQTVPSRPMKGAVEPVVARSGRPGCRRLTSVPSCVRMARSMRSRRSALVSLASWSRQASRPASITRPASPRRSPSSSARTACSKARACRWAARRRSTLSKITVQQQIEASTRRIITPLTTGSACRNRPTNENSCEAAACAATSRDGTSDGPAASMPGLAGGAAPGRAGAMLPPSGTGFRSCAKAFMKPQRMDGPVLDERATAALQPLRGPNSALQVITSSRTIGRRAGEGQA